MTDLHFFIEVYFLQQEDFVFTQDVTYFERNWAVEKAK